MNPQIQIHRVGQALGRGLCVGGGGSYSADLEWGKSGREGRGPEGRERERGRQSGERQLSR